MAEPNLTKIMEYALLRKPFRVHHVTKGPCDKRILLLTQEEADLVDNFLNGVCFLREVADGE